MDRRKKSKSAPSTPIDRPAETAPPNADRGASDDPPTLPDSAAGIDNPPIIEDAAAPADAPPSDPGAPAEGPSSTEADPALPVDADLHGEGPPSIEADSAAPVDSGAPNEDSADGGVDRSSSTESAATPGEPPPFVEHAVDESSSTEPDVEEPEDVGKAARDGLPPEPEPSEPPGTEDGVQVGAAAPVDQHRPAPEESAAPPEPVAAPASDEVPYLNVLEVREMDWAAVREAVANPISGERAERIIERMEERLAGGGPLGLAFEEYAAGPDDRAIAVGEKWPLGEVWFVGDVHGDLLALEAALQHIDRSGGGADARIVFLGDLFDDGVHSAEVALRVFELALDGPMRITVVTGNHDEALAFADGRFQSTVLPSDFTDWLNANPDHPWAARLGRLIIHFFQRAPRALFFPDGLLVAHGGMPHTDLHEELAESGNWNDPRVLQDFVWLRAHPRARKRIPNRTTRGSEFGREDFAAFCALATGLGRPVARMVRGHDHVEERFAVYPAWSRHPALTINALSHRLPREVFGDYERVPVVARWVRGELPEVRRLFIPAELIREIYPEPADEEGAA
ncbi:MAG TPA: metallophosphoesterase [Longimicrobium sp.]|nr:metallophosphoesterase [Longimicrobium sp.]